MLPRPHDAVEISFEHAGIGPLPNDQRSVSTDGGWPEKKVPLGVFSTTERPEAQQPATELALAITCGH